MILRKPYAILIKNFKIIHAVLAILMSYLLYRTNMIMSFISEYISSTQTVIKSEVLDTLFGNIFFILVGFIILFSIIVLSLLVFKKKPIKFYLYNIATYIYSIVIYVVAFYTIQKLQYGLLDMKTLKLIQDLLTAALIFQVVALLIVVIRATGFNIKNFNFQEDLEQIEIEETDNEEFEVDLDVDTDKLMRRIRKRFRYAKYVYVENKFFINIILLIFLAASITFMYFNIDVYSKTYKKYESFKTTQFIFGTEDSFRTKYDYKNNILKEGYQAVVVRINVKRLYYRKISLNTGRIALKTNNNLYYHEIDYKDKLVDLGIIYNDEIIPNDEFVSYILVFMVKEEDIKDKMQLRYTDTTGDVVKISISPNNLNNEKEEKQKKITEEMLFNNSIFKETKLKIDSIELADSFKIDYNYCVNTNCYPSTEYINISASDNYNKTILKIVGTFSYDEKLPIIKNNNLYKFISNYGIITYIKDGKLKTLNIDLKEIKPRKTNQNNTYYIEVPSFLKDAQNINLKFNIRNTIYTYNLK